MGRRKGPNPRPTPKHTVIIEPETEEELQEAASYYEQKQEGLGERFVSDMENTFRRAAATPLAFGFAFSNVQIVRASIFPYLAFFRLEGDTIRIVGVRHEREDPGIRAV